MTSKNLFSKMLFDNLKRRLWTIALSVLLLFIALPIVGALSIGEEGVYNHYNNIMFRLMQILSTNNLFLLLITIVGAVVCGLSGFYYLHSKKKVDLYHSVPVKRQLLFAVHYMNGILIYLVPYIMNLLVTLLIIQINGYMNFDMFKIAMVSLFTNLVFYVLIYTLTIIAVMLTGNNIISIFGIGVFLGYGPMLMLIKETYFTEFLKHYSGTLSSKDVLTFLSPIGSYIHLGNIEINMGATMIAFQDGLGMGLIKAIIITLVFIAFALYLYIKRPSEAAGKSMSYDISKPIIKFFLVVPLTLLGGILLREIANVSGTVGWFIFGLVFSFFIISAIIEILFQFDIKAAFNHKKQLLFSGIVVGVVASIFGLDLFQYDAYLPDKDQIEYMSVYISGMQNDMNYVNLDEDYTGDRYISARDYHLKEVKLEDFEAAYELAKVGISYDTETDNSEVSIYREEYVYTVKYVLKNGKKVTRSYQLASGEDKELLAAIYNNKEYKEKHYQIYDINASDINQVTVYSDKSSKELTLTRVEMEELLAIYKEELGKLSLEDIGNLAQVTRIRFGLQIDYGMDFWVYSNFTKTIEFLSNHGFYDYDFYDVDNVREIVINYYGPIEFSSTEDILYEKGSMSKSYTDKEKIAEVLANSMESSVYWNHQCYLERESNFDIYVSGGSSSNTLEKYTIFKKGQVPEFVKKDLGINQ
ncbi:MAG: DUF6449 domain-containing protein [Anaerocolumna sp.]